MRIISKHKDFYDFLAQDYDADIIYVRKPFLVYENYDELYIKKGVKKYLSREPLWFSKERDAVKITNFVFGIYPYVYSQPVLHIMLSNSSFIDRFVYVLSKTEVDECLKIKKDDGVPGYLRNLAQKEAFNIVKKHEYIKIPKSLKMCWMHNFNEYYWKIECPDVFIKIGAPVFIRDDGDYVNLSQYGLEAERNEKIHYIANFWFTKLPDNYIKAWFDELMDMNTYINIENFLWASKKEPESTPDNKTKIINHGFDLKTSFRKM